MSQQLEALTRGLVVLLNEMEHGLPEVAVRNIHALDVTLTEIAKLRADHPKQIAHAHRVANAFAADFACDEEPEVKQGDGTDIWVQCWMLVKTDPAGTMS